MPSLFPEGTGKAKSSSTRRPPLHLSAPDPDPLEAIHQETLFRTVDLNLRALPALLDLYAVPNGGKRDPATAKAMQRQGVRKGVADMSLDFPSRGYHGLKLELKRFRNGTIELEQAERLTRNAANGYRAIVCWGWIAAWEEILWYLGREDLLIPSGRITTQIIEAYPASPFWQRQKPKM